MANHLIQGDPLNPDGGDLIAQTTTIKVGEPVPEGWQVLTGNNEFSQIGRFAFRFEIEEESNG